MGYDSDKCDSCGECLTRCPYVPLSSRRARREMRRMRDGRSSVMHEKCAGCMTCSAVCAGGNDPYALIRMGWNERHDRKGLPARAEFLLPTAHPNFRDGLRVTARESAILAKAREIPAAKTVLYTGCNTLAFPLLLESSVMKGLVPFGSLDYCCGEMYYRMGLMDAARETARRLEKTFSGLRADRMVFSCVACMNMISNVYPREFGIDFPFEKTFISDWTLEALERGDIEVVEPLKGRVVVQDPCHAKVMTPKLHDSPRKLLAALGLEVAEMKHARDESLCCGIAAACARYSAADVAGAALRRLAEATFSGADFTATYCFGCQLSLDMARVCAPFAPRNLPLLHFARKALGEKPDAAIYEKRARAMLGSVLAATAPKMLSADRFNAMDRI